ncbi:MAG: class I SAM-dependent methyltransferase [Rhodospirillales bacterium]|nr:class I SAM-dependent methyltransferase [Rhodospirillales bacterium]
MTGWCVRLRRSAFGLATIAGLNARGWFIPYRHAGAVRTPDWYPALERIFAAAAGDMRLRLAAASRYRHTLLGFAGEAPPAPRLDQDWFPRLDAILAYTFARDLKPRQIVEIGSGHSTRFLARAIADGGLVTRLVSVDPAPRATLDGLRIETIRTGIQEAPAEIFATLTAGDFLIIDSSHILMPGSDVDLLFNAVLPSLPPGVLVHIHDVFLPEGYPADWAWRGYNEQNAAAAFLVGGGFRLLWASHWALRHLTAEIWAAGLDRLPLVEGARESSLWMVKA